MIYIPLHTFDKCQKMSTESFKHSKFPNGTSREIVAFARRDSCMEEYYSLLFYKQLLRYDFNAFNTQ